MEVNLHNHRFGHVFLDDTRSTSNKRKKADKLNSNKIKSFCASKDTINEVQKQSTEWDKIFTSPVSSKRLISKIYKGLLQLNS